MQPIIEAGISNLKLPPLTIDIQMPYKGIGDISAKSLNAATAIALRYLNPPQAPITIVNENIRIKVNKLPIGSFNEISYKDSKYIIHKDGPTSFVIYQVIE